MEKIELSNGMVAFVDDEDYDRLAGYNWQHLNGYAIRRKHIKYENGKAITKRYRMHREIMGTPMGFETDHINGNRLDNRKANLRICNSSQNKANKGLGRNNTTGYKGVIIAKRTRDKKAYPFIRARITVNKKQVWLGCYKTFQEAAEAYNKAAIKYFGEFANLNVIEAVQ
jgi:hypothetical protein